MMKRISTIRPIAIVLGTLVLGAGCAYQPSVAPSDDVQPAAARIDANHVNDEPTINNTKGPGDIGANSAPPDSPEGADRP